MRHSKRVTLSTDDINSALVASGKEVAAEAPSALPCGMLGRFAQGSISEA